MKMALRWLWIVVALALSPSPYATAATEATQACKDCVMQCVMVDNKDGRDCLHVHTSAPACVCDSKCAGVDRRALMKLLRDEALAKCKQDNELCKKNAGDDPMQQNICALNLGACNQRAYKMF